MIVPQLGLRRGLTRLLLVLHRWPLDVCVTASRATDNYPWPSFVAFMKLSCFLAHVRRCIRGATAAAHPAQRETTVAYVFGRRIPVCLLHDECHLGVVPGQPDMIEEREEVDHCVMLKTDRNPFLEYYLGT